MRVSPVSSQQFTILKKRNCKGKENVNSPSFGKVYFPFESVYKKLWAQMRKDSGFFDWHIFSKDYCNRTLADLYYDARDVFVYEKSEGKFIAETLTDCGKRNPLFTEYEYGKVMDLHVDTYSNDVTFIRRAVFANDSRELVCESHPNPDLNQEWKSRREFFDKTLFSDYFRLN